ncbi:hypothetical protein Bca4012_009531 [Brassica carinata]
MGTGTYHSYFRSKGNSIFTCDFCRKVSHRGGINRMKQYLARVKGSTKGCKKVPLEVKNAMRKSLKENEDRAKEKRRINRQVHDFDDDANSYSTILNKKYSEKRFRR